MDPKCLQEESILAAAAVNQADLLVAAKQQTFLARQQSILSRQESVVLIRRSDLKNMERDSVSQDSGKTGSLEDGIMIIRYIDLLMTVKLHISWQKGCAIFN